MSSQGAEVIVRARSEGRGVRVKVVLCTGSEVRGQRPEVRGRATATATARGSLPGKAWGAAYPIFRSTYWLLVTQTLTM